MSINQQQVVALIPGTGGHSKYTGDQPRDHSKDDLGTALTVLGTFVGIAIVLCFLLWAVPKRRRP
jgi:hypothetical protein